MEYFLSLSPINWFWMPLEILFLFVQKNWENTSNENYNVKFKQLFLLHRDGQFQLGPSAFHHVHRKFLVPRRHKLSDSFGDIRSDALRICPVLKGRCTQILIFFKIIYFTKTIMRTSFFVHFVLRCSKMEWERYKGSTIFTKYLINEIL